MQNPFNPTFGDVPKIYLDNGNQAESLAELIQNSEFSRSFFITGVRGSGKTTFMTQVETLLTHDSKCLPISLINDEHLLESFVNQLAHAVESKSLSLAKKLQGFTAGPISMSFSNEKSGSDVITKVVELMQIVKKKHQYVLVTIDEVDNSRSIRSFAQVFSDLKRHQMPIFALMTGLPDLILNVQNEKKLTFLLRSEKITMEPLGSGNTALSYSESLGCDWTTAQQMANMVRGYSYAFQLLGYLAFEQQAKLQRPIQSADLKTIEQQYIVQLFDNAYQKIFVDLSTQDKRYLIAVADHRQFKDVVSLMHQNASYVSQYRRRAIERHLVVPAAYGRVEYTLPYFAEYLKAVQDPNSVYFDYLEF
ncbi:P-loop NTPase fold protein [Limosilactobacillus mucosae]|uniref:P-loop NTPase fold protein n=1 Tax=Limosilactobacillus mucosae TaxID=97478 RepID=UPI00399259C4